MQNVTVTITKLFWIVSTLCTCCCEASENRVNMTAAIDTLVIQCSNGQEERNVDVDVDVDWTYFDSELHQKQNAPLASRLRENCNGTSKLMAYTCENTKNVARFNATGLQKAFASYPKTQRYVECNRMNHLRVKNIHSFRIMPIDPAELAIDVHARLAIYGDSKLELRFQANQEMLITLERKSKKKDASYFAQDVCSNSLDKCLFKHKLPVLEHSRIFCQYIAKKCPGKELLIALEESARNVQNSDEVDWTVRLEPHFGAQKLASTVEPKQPAGTEEIDIKFWIVLGVLMSALLLSILGCRLLLLHCRRNPPMAIRQPSFVFYEEKDRSSFKLRNLQSTLKSCNSSERFSKIPASSTWIPREDDEQQNMRFDNSFHLPRPNRSVAFVLPHDSPPRSVSYAYHATPTIPYDYYPYLD